MFFTRKRFRFCLTTLLVLAVAWGVSLSVARAAKPAPPPPVKYRMAQIPSLIEPATGAAYSCYHRGMNNLGDVVGSANDSTGQRGFYSLYPYGVTIDLNNSPSLPEGWHVVSLDDINDSGQIAGVAVWLADSTDRPFGTYRPFLYDLASDSFLWFPEPQIFPWIYSTAINNLGQIVGVAYTEVFNERHYFVWTTQGEQAGVAWLNIDHVTDLNVRDINDAGQLIYNGRTASGEFRAFRYTPASATAAARFDDLGVFGPLSNGESRSIPWAINNLGQIAGLSTSPDGDRAFRYTDGVGMVNLGVLDAKQWCASTAGSINDAGQVTGYSTVYASAKQGYLYRPMLYTEATKAINLWPLISNPPAGMTENDLGQAMQDATINNPCPNFTFGQIAVSVKGVMYVLEPDR